MQAKTTVLQNSNCLLLWRQVKPQVFFEYFMPDMSTKLTNTHHTRGTDGLKNPVSVNGNKKWFKTRVINLMLHIYDVSSI